MGEIHLLPPREHRTRSLTIIALILVPFLFGALAVFLGQDSNWDLRNYHWYNAYAFLNGRYGFDVLPSQTPYFYNPTLDVPFYLLATHLPAKTVGFLLGTLQGLNFVLLFMLAYAALLIPNPRHKWIVCFILAGLGMMGGGGIAQLGTVFYDNVTSLGLFLSALLVIRHFDRLISAHWQKAFNLALLFGIPSGLMMGLKLPSVIFCLGLCFALLFVGGTIRRRFLISFAFGLGVLLGTAITLGHWAWFLQTHFDSPLFPYFNQYFQAPLVPLTSARDIQFVPGSLSDRLLFPFIFAAEPFRVGEIAWRDWRIPILYILLPLGILAQLFFGRAKNRTDAIVHSHAQRYLLWACAISYIAWLLMFGIYRYLIPLEMLAPLLIVFAIGMVPLKTQTRALIAGFVLLIAAASLQPGNWGRRAEWIDPYVKAEIPPLGDTSDLMILMASFEPYAHVLNLFPPEIPFVRIQSNFASPNQDKNINRIIHERVDGHKGRFMLLIPLWKHDLAAEALGYFGLKVGPKPCQRIPDRLYDDNPLDLCEIIRTKN